MTKEQSEAEIRRGQAREWPKEKYYKNYTEYCAKNQNWSNANPENSVPCRVSSSCFTSAKLYWTKLTSCFDNRYNKWEKIPYSPISNIKIVERDIIDTTNTQTHSTHFHGLVHAHLTQSDGLDHFMGLNIRVCNWSNTMGPRLEQELFALPEHPSSFLVFSRVRVAHCLVFCVVICRSLFIFLSFFFWPLCLSLYLRPLITTLVFPSFS